MNSAIIVLLGLVATTIALPTNDTKSIRFLRKIKTFFPVIESRETWLGALAKCHLYGMELASINTAEEFDTLRKLLINLGLDKDSLQFFWTSGMDYKRTREFIWMTSGRRLTYTAWGAGEPNNLYDIEDCLEVLTFNNAANWNDDSCMKSKYYICEYY